MNIFYVLYNNSNTEIRNLLNHIIKLTFFYHQKSISVVGQVNYRSMIHEKKVFFVDES